MKNPIKNICLLAGGAAALMAGPVAAEEAASRFDYSYVEVQFLHTNFDTDEFTVAAGGTTGTFTDATSNGFGVEAAFGQQVFADNLHLYAIADYMQFDTDLGVALQGVITGNGFAPVEFTEWRIGAGAAFEVDPRVALFAEAGYLSTDVEFSLINGLVGGPIGLAGLNLSGSGLDLRAGVRVAPSERVELFGFVRYNPHGQIENSGATMIEFSEELRYALGGRYRFTEHLSAGVEYEFGKPGTVRLSARFSF